MSQRKVKYIPNANVENTIDDENINLDDIEDTPAEIKQIPSSSLCGYDLKKIKNFNILRQSYKLDNQKLLFVTKTKEILKLLDPLLNKLNTKLLILICNSANNHFIYGSKLLRESSKLEAIHELMLPYFGTIETLTIMMINIKHKIIKSNFIKRFYKRCQNLFFLKNMIKY